MALSEIQRIGSAVVRRARARWRGMSAIASRVQRPTILMYHRIAEEKFDPWGLAVAPDKFAEQLRWLAKNRTPLSLSVFAELHRRGRLPDDAVAVTFDDGYACTAQVAAPLLDRYRVPATIFIPAGVIGRWRLFWWDELSQIVMTYPETTAQVRGRRFELGDRQPRDAIWPADNRRRTPRQRGFYDLWAYLRPLAMEDIQQILGELRAAHAPSSEDETHRLITQDEIRSMGSNLIEFGSHALTHVSLPGLTSSEKEREIYDSVAACEELAGTRPVTFAYPFGDSDSHCEELVARAGFACACTVEPRAVAADDNLFALPRVKIGNWNWRQLRQELAVISCHR